MHLFTFQPSAAIASARTLRRGLLVGAAALLLTGAARAQAYVNITVGGAFAPGVYGQIAIGNNPPPPLLNPTPVTVGQPVYGAPAMYLYVTPQEYSDWGHHCWRYNACGRPVYFVRVDGRERWWDHHNQHLRGEGHYGPPPVRIEPRGGPHGQHRGWDRGERGEGRREEHRSDQRDEGHGNPHGRGGGQRN